MLHAYVRRIVGQTEQKAIRRVDGLREVLVSRNFTAGGLLKWASGMKQSVKCSTLQARGFPVEKCACEKSSRAVSLEAMLAA